MASLLAASAVPRLSWADAGSPAYLAAARESDGGYALFGLDRNGQDLFRIVLPGRGHAATAHPFAPEAVAFARRPGTFALVIDCMTGGVAHRLESPEGHHFYGHGAFIAGGELLCTTENHIDSGEGRIGIWSRRQGYRRIAEIESGGIGPHEILSLPGDMLAIANGGIRTHPEQGREKLNISEMRPNLAYASLDGVVEVVELAKDMRLASIRHLASDGRSIAFAMQWQGELPDTTPLLGLHRPGETVRLCCANVAEQTTMKGYAGSVAIAGERVAITSPRGGRLHVFDLEGAFQGNIIRADVCGVAPRGADFLATDGHGGVMGVQGQDLRPLNLAARSWDNHLVQIG